MPPSRLSGPTDPAEPVQSALLCPWRSLLCGVSGAGRLWSWLPGLDSGRYLSLASHYHDAAGHLIDVALVSCGPVTVELLQP